MASDFSRGANEQCLQNLRKSHFQPRILYSAKQSSMSSINTFLGHNILFLPDTLSQIATEDLLHQNKGIKEEDRTQEPWNTTQETKVKRTARTMATGEPQGKRCPASLRKVNTDWNKKVGGPRRDVSKKK